MKLNIWYARYLLAEHLEERLHHKSEQEGRGQGGSRKASTNVSGAHFSSAPGSAVRNECLTPDRCLIPESPRVLLVQ